MPSTPSASVARRDAIRTPAPGSGTVATRQPDGALTLKAGQTRFDEQQRAALATLGIPATAPQADLDVFLHVSQRMGLDPFAKQIHLIYYRVNEQYYDRQSREWVDNWIEKPSIQTGIAGFRVQRERVAKREGVLIDYEDTVWFDEEGHGYDVWLWDKEPTAARVVVKISDGRRFSATIRFNEFAKRNKKKELTGRWRDGHSYQIEKCAEAAGLRKAFPEDFAGIDLEDEIASDPDAPPPAPVTAPRVTGDMARERAEQARQRQPQRVQATVVDPGGDELPPPPDAPYGQQPQAPARPQRPAPAQPDGDPRAAILAQFDAIGVAGNDQATYLTRLIGRPIASVDGLKLTQAQWFAVRLAGIGSRDELEAAAVAAEAKREGDGTPGE